MRFVTVPDEACRNS